MPDAPITGLPAGQPPAPSDELAAVQSGTTKRITAEDYEGPLLPGWDSVPALQGSAAPGGTAAAAIGGSTPLAGADVTPVTINSFVVSGETGQIVLIGMNAALNCTSAILSPFTVLFQLTFNGGATVVTWEQFFNAMVANQQYLFTTSYPIELGSSADFITLQVGLLGNNGANLLIAQSQTPVQLWAVVLPSVAVVSTTVLRYSGPIPDGLGGFLLDGLGGFILF